MLGPKHHRGTAMEHYAGIDVSLKDSSVCVVDATGRIVREAKVASEPEALAAWFRGLGIEVALIGLEAGPLSQWLHAGLGEAGFEAVLLETRHVKAALGPTMSRTFSTNSGSVESLKVSTRCGFRPKARQMRQTAVWFRPVALAKERVLQ